MSVPTSAISTSAVRRPIPGMLVSRSSSSATERSRLAISTLTSAIAASRKSMCANTPRKRSLQGRQLVTQPALGQLRYCRRVGLAVGQRGEHLATGESHDVGGDVAQLDVGAFQRLLQPIDFGGPFLHQAGAIPGQLAKFTLASVRDEATPQ